MTNIIKHCRGGGKKKKKKKKKRRGIRAIDGFRKQLMIPDHEISLSVDHVVKSKIGTIFVIEKILEKYSVKVYEINPYFHEHYNKKYKLTTMIKNTHYLELIFILLNIL